MSEGQGALDGMLERVFTAIKWASFVVMVLALIRIATVLVWGAAADRGPALRRALLYLLVGAVVAVAHFVRERNRPSGTE